MMEFESLHYIYYSFSKSYSKALEKAIISLTKFRREYNIKNIDILF